MNSTQSNSTNPEPKATAAHKQLKAKPQKPEVKEPTRGQRLADTLASKVGSWPFLIGQTTVLAGWVGANLMPGVPHWDQSPFILLNLMFSFASAYTAPIVLMSQNRQSDAEGEQNAYNHKVNLKTAHDMELLHEKIDDLSLRQLPELLERLNQQQQSSGEIKLIVLPTQPAPVAENEKVAKASTSDTKAWQSESSALLPRLSASHSDQPTSVGFVPVHFIHSQNQSVNLTSSSPYFKLGQPMLILNGLAVDFNRESSKQKV
ncbi:MAG TPA: DUF1003 domain-containing protein [Coleofasciculaceae cyanobacterium]|jgi:uncharacterized membrane protein